MPTCDALMISTPADRKADMMGLDKRSKKKPSRNRVMPRYRAATIAETCKRPTEAGESTRAKSENSPCMQKMLKNAAGHKACAGCHLEFISNKNSA